MTYEKDELTEKVREFISIMKENGLAHLRVKNDEFELELGEKPPMPFPPAMPPMPQMMPPQNFQPAPPPAGGAAPAGESGSFIRSPIVGTFYAASAPGKPPYAPIGKEIKKGDVVFIIESMKLMNEVKSEIDGKVAEVLVSDGEAVEFDQPILRIV